MTDTISAVSKRVASNLQAMRDAHPDAKPLPPGGQCSPDCEICGGSGLVRYDVPTDDYRFGKLDACPNLPTKAIEGRYGLSIEEQDLLWSAIAHTDRSVTQAVNIVGQVLDRGYGWVYLWGGYGTAKTMILKTAIAEVLRHERHGVYVRMVDLLDDLRKAYDAEDSMTELVARVNYWTGIPYLAIDEIDRIKQTDWARERVFQIMDRRYSWAEVSRSATLIASNASPNELDPYLESRVRDGRFAVVQMTGPDYRPAMEY